VDSKDIKLKTLAQNYSLAMTQMGVDVTGMAHTGHMHGKDQLHDHAQNALQLGVEHSQHMDQLHADHAARIAEDKQRAEDRKANAQVSIKVDNDKLGDVADAMSKIAEGLKSASDAQGETQAIHHQATQEQLKSLHAAISAPRKKKIKVQRDAKGNLVGADVEETLH